jgi:pilus assembly protein CpaC
LEVAPSFSTINSDATVGGIPGLNRRSVDTTVDLREGQWLAIAGLIQDEQGGQRTRTPYLGDLPFLGGFFSNQSTSRLETELVVLVSPELVHPLETEQVPLLLPGMEVTEATDDDFFMRNLIEGYRGFDHRSTVWPEVQRQENGLQRDAFVQQVRSVVRRRIRLHQTYVCGPSGLSR